MRAGDRLRGLVAHQAIGEGTVVRVRYYGGEEHGGSVAEVRELRSGAVSVWVDGFRVREHASMVDFFARWHATEADLRDAR